MENPVEMVDNLRSLRSLSKPEESPPEIIGIFAKEPVAGRVKTRLCPPLNANQAAALYRTALIETVENLRGGGRPLVLFFAGDETFFRRTFPGMPLVPQETGDLGVRMAAALALLLRSGFRIAALVGSDSPDLPPRMIDDAFAALRTAAAAAIPARDGGYVLIGESRHCAELFRNVPWSSPRVLEVTRQRAAAAGVELRETGAWDDLDDLASLRRLIRRSPQSTTARLAARLLTEAADPERERDKPGSGLETG